MLALGACSAPPSPSIVLITVDTLRATTAPPTDTPSTPRRAWSSSPGRRPARDGRRAHAQHLPAHARLFTSRYPLATRYSRTATFGERVPGAGRGARRSRYTTAAFVSSSSWTIGSGTARASNSTTMTSAGPIALPGNQSGRVLKPEEFERPAHEMTTGRLAAAREGSPRRPRPFNRRQDPHQPDDPAETLEKRYVVLPWFGGTFAEPSRSMTLDRLHDRELGRLLDALDEISPPETPWRPDSVMERGRSTTAPWDTVPFLYEAEPGGAAHLPLEREDSDRLGDLGPRGDRGRDAEILGLSESCPANWCCRGWRSRRRSPVERYDPSQRVLQRCSTRRNCFDLSRRGRDVRMLLRVKGSFGDSGG